MRPKPKPKAAKIVAKRAIPKPKPKERPMVEVKKPDPAPPPPAVKSPAPANTTYSPDPAAPTAFAVVPEDMLTEQEKDTASEVPGVGPASASEVSPGPVETMEDLGIGPRTPYPEGSPPVAADAAVKKDPTR
jgi:hypothetical protein